MYEAAEDVDRVLDGEWDYAERMRIHAVKICEESYGKYKKSVPAFCHDRTQQIKDDYTHFLSSLEELHKQWDGNRTYWMNSYGRRKKMTVFPTRFRENPRARLVSRRGGRR